MKINIDKDTAIHILMDRLEYWIENHTEESKTFYRKLFRTMYENYYCDDGEYGEFDPAVIVDNDYINYCRTVWKDDNEYKSIQEKYDNDETDWKCGNHYERIEAATLDYDSNTVFLIRTIL